MENQIYHQISARTGGDIYIGVVGPVRTGKSTLIKRFMETMVLPGMDNMYKRERARDELPQSGTGRTIMTAEPKFVPEEAQRSPCPMVAPAGCGWWTVWVIWWTARSAAWRTTRRAWCPPRGRKSR